MQIQKKSGNACPCCQVDTINAIRHCCLSNVEQLFGRFRISRELGPMLFEKCCREKGLEYRPDVIEHLLATYYKPYGNTQALLNGRGGSTLALPIAQADLMIFNLAIAVGFITRLKSNRAPYFLMAGLFGGAQSIQSRRSRVVIRMIRLECPDTDTTPRR